MKKLIVLLAMTMSVSAMAAADFTCSGTEPFWDLSIKGDKVTYNGFFQDESTKTEDVLSRENAVGVQDDFAVVITTATSTASIIGGECNDGMSDNVYSHNILYKSGDSVLVGCCNIAK